MREGLDAVQDNDAAVKAFGVQYVTDMCKRLIDSGAPGLHLYTLNQVRRHPETLNHEQYTLNPEPQIPNHKHYTRNHQHYTLNAER